MTPSRGFLASIATVVGASAAFLAELTPFVLVTLLKASFTPSLDLDPATVTPADFTGATAKHAASASTQVFLDSATGEYVMQVNEPAGGWHWQATNSTNLPQVIYGYMVTDSAGAVLIGSELFDTPKSIGLVGHGVDIGNVRFKLAQGAIL